MSVGGHPVFFQLWREWASVLIDLQWQRIRTLGEQQRWLAFERALSEMIGGLAGKSCRQDWARDIYAARYARGLCYQLRGLESARLATSPTLLVGGFRSVVGVLAAMPVLVTIGCTKKSLGVFPSIGRRRPVLSFMVF